MMSLLIMIKNWITGLGLWDKIVGGIMSFVTGGALKKFCDKFKSTEEEKAFKRAVKRWNSSFYIRGYYKKNKVKTINEFCEYVIGHHGVYDDDIDTLYRLFEEELQKTHEGREFLQSIRIKLLNKDQYDSLMKTNDILNEQKKLHEMLAEIKQELCTHNKGIREFTAVDGYIQRYCTLRLKSDEYFKYYWEHKGIKRYKLADIVAGRTDCKGRKFVLYSDAQTGKTTELLRLGWELQEEGRLVPIMFKVRGNQSIKQELPALRPDIEKGLVVIVDALDEKFDGDARFGLYHEIETYAEELLAQLPKTSALCKQILAWIVEDNKELVLYIDRKLLTIEERTVIFKDIIEWHKSKNLRFADIGTSRYEDLMMFGKSEDSIDYLMSELEVCNEIDCHAVNVLFLLRYVRQEDLSLEKAGVLRKRILNIFEMFKEDDEHIYIFFEVLRNPWLQTEETVDEVYDILKDSDHPNIVDHFVEFVVEAGCAEKYADVIIEKGQYIKNYNKDCRSIILRRRQTL